MQTLDEHATAHSAIAKQNNINAQHSAKSAEWYTPNIIAQTAREFFQGEYLVDPASNAIANSIIGADLYYTAEDDGLSKPWYFNDSGILTPSAVFLNPPGGKGIGNVSLPRLFWEKLMQEVADGNVHHAVYLAYSVEQLQQLQDAGIHKYTVCLPPKRVRYLQQTEDGLQAMKSPTHASAIVYVNGAMDNSFLFKRSFASIGACYDPAHVNMQEKNDMTEYTQINGQFYLKPLGTHKWRHLSEFPIYAAMAEYGQLPFG